jgi:acyl-CoA thioesterase-1
MNKQAVFISLIVLLLGTLLWWFFMSTITPESTVKSLPPTVLPDENTINIIAFGDSLTAGYGVSQAEAYPAQLEAKLLKAGYRVSVVNAGVSGETSRGNLERANFIRMQEPDIVIMGVGGNDALRALPVAETKKNIKETIRILREGETPPKLLLLKIQAPLNAGTEYKEQFDSLYETIASEEGVILVPFITEDIFLDTAYKLPDGIHYNELGYEKVIEQYLFPHVTKLLEQMVDVQQ